MANIRKPLPEQRMAVAFSGGRDSSVLLDLLSQHPEHPAVLAFHIHHGLQAQADAWVTHCEAFCRERGIALYVRHVQVRTQGQGTEAAAREARYAALKELARELEVTVIALAHHAHDQAETALFNLARGAGSTGLAAMPAYRVDDDVTWWRPLLETRVQDIAAYAESKQLAYIEDPSNDDLRYSRNRIRHQVLPELERAVPGAWKGIARAVRHAQGAAELERQAGEHVLKQLLSVQAGEIVVDELKKLEPALRNAVLRAWFRQLQLPMPHEVQLHEFWHQVSYARSEAQVSIILSGYAFYRYRGKIFAEPYRPTEHPPANETLIWDGQSGWQLTGWRGRFVFEASSDLDALDETLLRSAPLLAKPREGGEKLRLSATGPSRSLKQWYQTLGVPTWKRQQSPMLYLGEQLLFVPDVGTASWAVTPPSKREKMGLKVVWQAAVL